MTSEMQHNADNTEAFDVEELGTEDESLTVESASNIRAGVRGYCYPKPELA